MAIYSTDYRGVIMLDCITNTDFQEESKELVSLGESVAERVLDGTDPNSGIVLKTKVCKIRRLTTTILRDLKVLYGYRCQVCGQYIGEKYDSNLIHAHHIDYFTKSLNNNSNNIMILCPNHHGIIHDKNPIFNPQAKTFLYPNGYEEGLKLNLHL
jgi:predicted restriction endonuclease